MAIGGWLLVRVWGSPSCGNTLQSVYMAGHAPESGRDASSKAQIARGMLDNLGCCRPAMHGRTTPHGGISVDSTQNLQL